MKNLILVLFVFISNMVLSQLNTDSIEAIMIRLTRKDRDLKGSSFLYTSERCKKVSKIHLDYSLKYLNKYTYSHDETIPFYCKKVLKSPSDRYDLFNKDSVSVKITEYYEKRTIWNYSGEIMTGCYVLDINDPNINQMVAEELFQNFKNSPTHYKSMMKTLPDGGIYRCNFSIGYTKEMLNGVEFIRFDCIGVFDRSTFYSTNPSLFNKSKQSNFYFD